MGNFFKFWGLVLAKGAIMMWEEAKGTLKGALFWFGLVVILPVFGSYGLVKYDINPLQNIATDELAVAVLSIAGILLFYGVTSFIRIPPMMYGDLGGFSENPLLLKLPIPGEQKNVQVWVGIEVHNPTKITVHNCVLRLINVVNLETNDITPTVSENLLWSTREGGNDVRNRPKDIGADFRICDVARTDAKLDRAIFELWFGHPQPVRQGNYLLRIELTGSWRGFNFTSTYELKLKYSGNYDLELYDIEVLDD